MRAGKDNLAIPFRVEGQTELDLRRLLKKTVQQGRSSLVLALKRVGWLISIARVERAPSERARSASRRTTRLPVLTFSAAC